MSTTTTAPPRFVGSIRIRDAFKVYITYPSARFLAAMLAISVVARLVVGQWSWWDLVAVVVMIAAQPFVEWIIHTFILHFRPRAVRGRTVDLHLAKKHRLHHRDPKRIDAVFIPMRPLLIGLPIYLAIVLIIFPLPIALTIVVTQFVIGNVYEWTHFYVHSGCKPKNRYAAYIERAHRLHHYRNENYWMGVTNHLGDHVLGTFPDKDEVPVSPTAKTLGIETTTS